MLMRSSVVTFFLLAGGLAFAGEAAKPKPKPRERPDLPAPTVEEMDKPSKPPPGAPQPLPDDPPAAKPKEGEGDAEAAKPKPKTVNPFRGRGRKPKYARPARVTYSDGTVLEGWTWHRANSPVRLFVRAERAHESFFVSDLKRIDAKPETENFERDWRWKNQGSSEKVFLDVGYFWNQYVTTFTTTEDEVAVGDCSGQFYLLTLDGKRAKWYLYKRQSARDKQKKKRHELEPIVYVKSVEFTDDFLKKLEEERKKAEAEAVKKEAAKPAVEKK